MGVRGKPYSRLRSNTWHKRSLVHRPNIVLVTVLIIASISAALAAIHVDYAELERACDGNALLCGMATNLFATGLVAFFASVIWIGFASQRTAVNRYLAKIRLNPHSIIGRREPPGGSAHDAVLNAILQELRIGRVADALLLIGASGSGKTEALIALARRLAVLRVIPIIVPLGRLAVSSDLVDEAKNCLRKEMDPFLRAEAHFDVVWRRYRRRQRIVILADALDELCPELNSTDRERELLRLLSGVSDGLHVVVSTRPYALPSQLRGPRFHLTASGPTHELPFFSFRLDGLETPTTPRAGSIEVRRKVLQNNVDRRIANQQLQESVSLLAVATLTLGRYECWQNDLVERAVEIGEAQIGAERLASALASTEQSRIVLVRTTNVGRLVSFEHPLVCAYLASRSQYLRRGLERFTPNVLPEAVQALQWASVPDRTSGATMADWMTDRLPALTGATGAVELVGELGLPPPGRIRRIWTERSGSVPVSDRLTFVESLHACLPDQEAIQILWSALEDHAYEVRWKAATVLARLRVADYGSISDLVERFLHLLEDGESSSINPAAIQERVFWFLPSLARTNLDTPEATSARHHLDRLLASVERLTALGVRGSLGLESSLAQGYKLEAHTNPGKPPGSELLNIARSSRFWYARAEAVLAIALKVRGGNGRTRRDACAFLRQATSADAHDLVVAAAEFAHDSIVTGEIETNVWLTEGDVLTSPAAYLSDRATLLLAETLLFLNLSANAEQDIRDANAALEQLPKCLEFGRHRARLLGSDGCATPLCPFGLCPYEREVSHMFFRGDFSETFSRNVIHAVHRTGTPPWFHGGIRNFIDPWKKFEERGRNEAV